MTYNISRNLVLFRTLMHTGIYKLFCLAVIVMQCQHIVCMQIISVKLSDLNPRRPVSVIEIKKRIVHSLNILS